MILLQNSKALGVGVQTVFEATGGVEPYTYEVQLGGAGGTIDVDGIYTAPLEINDDASLNTDTIIATDANNDTATATVSILNPQQLVCDIINNWFGFTENRVWIWDQKFEKPKDNDIFLVIRSLGSKVYGNNKKFDPNLNAQVHSINIQDQLQVEIMSRSIAANNRKEEVLMALESDYSESQQQANTFYLAKQTSSFVCLNEEDGAAIPYRYAITINLIYIKQKVMNTNYYDDFDNKLTEIFDA